MADIPSQLAAALRDRYALERELGRGGMAAVYLARDLKHDRPVAFKVIRTELGALAGAERFHREIGSPPGSSIPISSRCWIPATRPASSGSACLAFFRPVGRVRGHCGEPDA